MAASVPTSVMPLINEFLDLLPGIRVTPERLATILAWIKRDYVTMGGGTAAEPTHVVVLSAHTEDSDDEDEEGNVELTLLLMVRIPHLHAVTGHPSRVGSILLSQGFPFTPDGLLCALVEAKATIADHKARGLCPTCEARGQYRLKAATMPLCVPCVFNAFFAGI